MASTIEEVEETIRGAIATGFSVSDLMHATDEYVVVDDLVMGAKILEDFIINFLQKN